MSGYDYDLFVIGAGSGGVRASRLAASFGARVAVAEAGPLGGTCVNLGCIPKKLLVYAAHFRDELVEAQQGYGWSVGEAGFDWSRLIAAKDREIARLNGVYARLLDEAGVERIAGRARLLDPHRVAVGNDQYRARYILVATGSHPYRPPEIEGIEHAITSDDAFHLPSLPERVIVVGGGYIAVEFACILHGLGASVTQIYRGPLFLRGFDDSVRAHLAEQIREKGIDLRFERVPTRIEATGGTVRVTLNDGKTLEADRVLCATGRHPNSTGLGLQEVGVEIAANGAVEVDAYSQSSLPSVYAIGDVTNRVNLTPVAIHEGICLANTLFNDLPMQPDHENVPAAVFSQPQLATVGLDEATARERHGAIDVYESRFGSLKHTLTDSQEKILMKLVVERENGRVLGLHVVAPDAAEIVQGFAVAIKAGLTKADFDTTIGIHPTAAEELVTLREAR